MLEKGPRPRSDVTLSLVMSDSKAGAAADAASDASGSSDDTYDPAEERRRALAGDGGGGSDDDGDGGRSDVARDGDASRVRFADRVEHASGADAADAPPPNPLEALMGFDTGVKMRDFFRLSLTKLLGKQPGLTKYGREPGDQRRWRAVVDAVEEGAVTEDLHDLVVEISPWGHPPGGRWTLAHARTLAGGDTGSGDVGGATGDAIVYNHHTGSLEAPAGGSASTEAAPAAVPIVERVKAFFYEDSSFSRSFEDWAASNVGSVDPDSEEMKLEYTDMHKSFLGFFEERLTKFIEGCGSSSREFYLALKEAEHSHPESTDARFTQVMLAAIDFAAFMELMRDMAREQSQRSAAVAARERK